MLQTFGHVPDLTLFDTHERNLNNNAKVLKTKLTLDSQPHKRQTVICELNLTEMFG